MTWSLLYEPQLISHWCNLASPPTWSTRDIMIQLCEPAYWTKSRLEATFPCGSLSLVGWVLLPRHLSASLMACVFYGALWSRRCWGDLLLGRVCRVSSLEFITTSVIFQQHGGNCYARCGGAEPGPAQSAQGGRDNAHVSALSQGWDLVGGSRGTPEGAQWESWLMWMSH